MNYVNLNRNCVSPQAECAKWISANDVSFLKKCVTSGGIKHSTLRCENSFTIKTFKMKSNQNGQATPDKQGSKSNQKAVELNPKKETSPGSQQVKKTKH